jgi:hypothetical protein
MPCSHTSAIRRLVNLYAQRLAAEPKFNERVSLTDVLREANAQAVAEHDLYPEFDREVEPQSVAVDRELSKARCQAWPILPTTGARIGRAADDNHRLLQNVDRGPTPRWPDRRRKGRCGHKSFSRNAYGARADRP